MHPSPVAYNAVAKILHWIIALAIIGMLMLGLVMTEKEWVQTLGLDRMTLFMVHKSTGILILLLSLFRVVWHFAKPNPKLPLDMPVWQKHSAKLAYCGLYTLMLGLPLTGWAMSSLSPYGITIYGLFKWPLMPYLSTLDPLMKKDLGGLMAESHEALANAMIALLVLHIGAALYHHFIRRDTVLLRMLPACLGGIKA